MQNFKANWIIRASCARSINPTKCRQKVRRFADASPTGFRQRFFQQNRPLTYDSTYRDKNHRTVGVTQRPDGQQGETQMPPSSASAEKNEEPPQSLC